VKKTKYIRIRDVYKFYPFTLLAIRHLMLHNISGIRKTLIKVGGRIFIHTQRFDDWLENQTMKEDPYNILHDEEIEAAYKKVEAAASREEVQTQEDKGHCVHDSPRQDSKHIKG